MKSKYEIGTDVSVRVNFFHGRMLVKERMTFKPINYIRTHGFSEFALTDTVDSYTVILPDVYTQSLPYRLYTCEWDVVLFNKNDETWG